MGEVGRVGTVVRMEKKTETVTFARSKKVSWLS